MPLKPGPKPKAKSTGKLDQRRRDNKSTPDNKPSLKIKINKLENENKVLKEKSVELDMFKVFTKNHFKSSDLNKVREVIKEVVPKVENNKKTLEIYSLYI